MKQISLSTLIYLIALIEGINLMCFELITSRVMAIAFGSTMKVWANLLSLTLLFLALGYFLGGKMSINIKKRLPILYLLLFVSALYLYFFTPFSTYYITNFTVADSFLNMAFFISLLVGLPITVFGIITPIIISLYKTDKESHSGNIAGKIYGISTFGGVLATFIFGLHIIPIYGIHFSTLIISVLLALSILLLFFANKK